MTTQRPARFEAYPTDRFIEVVKAWVNHPWPITSDEGQAIYESLGLRGYAPRPNFFWSDFSTDKEPDSYYVVTRDQVSAIDMEVARLLPDGEASDDSPLYEIYTRYCNAIDTVFNGNATKHPFTTKRPNGRFITMSESGSRTSISRYL